MTNSRQPKHNWSIVAAEKFVQATRDSGYSSTACAVSELVDNALQAGATRVDIDIVQASSGKDMEISVTDNGCGMDLFTLRQALRFGGSSRFNDRSVLGRFGMGLPNSSLSQCRRVTVSSWQNASGCARGQSNVIGRGKTLQTYLDLDEVAAGQLVEVPRPKALQKPPAKRAGGSGTIVKWTRCDRLQFKRPSTICRHLQKDLARRFRTYLLRGIKIAVNGTPVAPFDPLYLTGGRKGYATPYGDEMKYRVSSDPQNPSAPVGVVSVRFVELPVAKWATLSTSEKRAMGIVNNAGASIMRADREVDHGWFFFGSKRKENYDDWWRCEIRFDTILDDAFGLTHTKQQIRPQQYLVECLTPDLEVTTRALSARARAAHAKLKAPTTNSTAERAAAERSRYLKPLRARTNSTFDCADTQYRIVEKRLLDGSFYAAQYDGCDVVIYLDPDHAFYREFYLPLVSRSTGDSRSIATVLKLLLLSAGRSELSMPQSQMSSINEFRVAWSKTLQIFLSG